MVNTLKLKQKFTMIKFIQIFRTINHQKIMNISFLSVILLDSIFVNSDKKYYPQIFFKKSKYAIKKKKIMKKLMKN